MKYKVIHFAICTFSLWTAAQTAAATPLNPDQVLNKISLTLRGRAPTKAELNAFTAAASGSEEAFVKAYGERLDAFMNEPSFAAMVDTYHQMWWHMPQGESTQLAAYIVTHDRPYSELLVKDYVYLSGDQASGYKFLDIKTDTTLPPEGAPAAAVRLSKDEGRFRSIFSNSDFILRFPDTATNRNRKRAIQVFRTFLCENLSNDLLPGVSLPASGPHGTNPECLGCHTRLDPMARFFDRFPPLAADFPLQLYDAQQAAAGSVVVQGLDGKAKTFSGAGESALGATLKDLPQTKQCLVQKIWEFAAGPNTRLPDATKGKLLATLEDTGRFKAVLREAFLHPYLWSTEAPSPLNFSDIAPLLKACTSCHAHGTAPDFQAAYPFRADPQDNKELLRRLYGAASSSPDFKRMPPGTQPALPTESLTKLRDWIAAGALDERLQPSLTDSDTKEILDD